MTVSQLLDVLTKSDIRLVQLHVIFAGEHRPYAISLLPSLCFITYLTNYLCKKKLVVFWPFTQRDLYHQDSYMPAAERLAG